MKASVEERARLWDLTVAAYAKSYWADDDDELDQSYGIGIVQRSHRLFSIGDVVIVAWSNGGGERARIFCRTSKGRTVTDYHFQYARHRYRRKPYKFERGEFKRYDDRTVVRVVEHPDLLTGLPPRDPAVRRFVVETLLAGDAALRVGEGSPVGKKESG